MSIDKYNIVLTDNAKMDLNEIYDYISKELLEAKIANKIMERIEQEILSLENNPYRYMEVTVKPYNKKYRKLVVKKYIVLYRINEGKKEVVIDDVIYGKRDYLA